MSAGAHVYVPVKLDAYLNYTSPYVIQYDPPRPNPVYLAPIPAPNYAALKAESQFIQHDIFEDVRQPPLLASADRARVKNERGGIYLHWSLPPPFRQGLAAADGYVDLAAKQKEGGYAVMGQQATESGSATFRQVPNRWIIRRTITNTSDYQGNMQVRQNTGSGSKQVDYPWQQSPDDLRDGQYSRKTVFMVESDQIRRIEDIPMSEDIEISTSPMVDFDKPASQQGQTYLGRTYAFKNLPDNTSKRTYAKSLTAVMTANPYFADFQTQNSSVFSFFDDLSVTYQGSQWNLANASISYSVVGYYNKPDNVDPLMMPYPTIESPTSHRQTPNERLDACMMKIKNPETLGFRTVAGLESSNSWQMQTFCHGSLNGIYWNICRQNQPASTPDASSLKVKIRYPGDIIQNAFDTSHPLAVGTNALDALFGWLSIQGNAVPSDIQGQLLRLRTYVLDINDDLDSQLEAEDLLATNNFVPTQCGTRYNFADPDSSKDPALLQALVRRNGQQSRYDSLVRQYDHFKRDMFSAWWKLVCDDGKTTTATVSSLQNTVSTLQTLMAKNLSLRKGSIFTAESQAFYTAIQSAAEIPFSMQSDPTILIAGLQGSWPKARSDPVNVRFQEQSYPIVSPNHPELNNNSNILDQVAKQVSPSIYTATRLLWNEADRLSGAFNYRGDYPKPDSVVPPDFYKDGDQWSATNDNGWFPLFVEYSVEFYDIPWNNWTFAPYGPEGRIGYRIKDGVDLAKLNLTDNYAVIKGRAAIVPQASAILETALDQVYAKVNPDVLEATISTADRKTLTDAVRNMDFLGTALTGLTDQLVTRMRGAHLTPIDFSSGKADVPQDILTKAQTIGMTKNDFIEMNSGSETTPFASLTPVTCDTSKYSPFKPVTHGQFRFTKFNIVDKFGQVVQGIKRNNDKITGGQGANDDKNHDSHTPLFPCLSEIYSLENCTSDPSLKGLANAVLRRADGLCSFVQLPPSINQPARVNADFVTQVSPGSAEWRRLEEHENPCRGYLVINYANASFQVFTTDGRFVREYCIRNGKVASLPFAPDAKLATDLDPLLLRLLNEFQTTSYMVNLFQNISTTIEAVQANPTHYAESMLSILGRPIALVTFGISLELEGPPLTNQSTIPLTKPSEPTDSVLGYNFNIKLGDRDNVFDGLYGFFRTVNQTTANFDMARFYSYHDPDAGNQIKTDTLRPFYADPLIDTYASTRNSQYKVYAALVDPFTPIHFYTAILPIKQLSIPPWALQNGVQRIASFFKMGPILSPTDVPPFDPTKAVAEDYRLDDNRRPAETGTLPVPAISVADWSWLQPYWDKQAGKTKYNALGVSAVDMKPRFEQAPYVATEGYLQMKNSFVKADVNVPPKS